MKLGGGGCDTTSWKKRLKERGDEFIKNPKIKAKFPDASPYVELVFEKVFRVPIEEGIGNSAVHINKGTYKTFDRELRRVEKAIENDKLISNFGSLFYNTDSIVKNNPVLGKLTDDLLRVNLTYQGRQQKHNKSFSNIIDFLKKEMKIQGMTNFFGNANLKGLQKAADRLEASIQAESMKVQAGTGSLKKLESLIYEEQKFYKSGEGKVFGELLKNIETDVRDLEIKIESDYRAKRKKAYDDFTAGKITRAEMNLQLKQSKESLKNVLSEKIKSEPMKNAVAEYIELMDDMYKVISKSIDAWGESLRLSMKDKNMNPEVIDEVVSKIKERTMPNKEKGYYPHNKRVLSIDFLDNLMPRMQAVSDALGEGIRTRSNAIDEALKQMNAYVDRHALGRRLSKELTGESLSSLEGEYSKNFLVSVKRYIDEVDRMNMIAHTDQLSKTALMEAKKMFKSGENLDGYAMDTVQMIRDMNSAMKGEVGFQNETANQLVRSLLGMEFVSKLGLNVRGALRNSTQAMLNWVEYGPKMHFQSMKFFRNNPNLDAEVKIMMQESGLEFSEDSMLALLGGAGGKKGFSRIKLSDKDVVEFKKPSVISGFTESISKASGKMGYLMRKVENFNRQSTFKLSFYRMYDTLKNSTPYNESLRRAGMSDTQIDSVIKSKARNYAIRMTTMLHFDYSDVAKSKALRHPVGKLMGQFQHYGFKFFEYNKNLLAEAKDDIITGNIRGPRAAKAYRMGMIYFLAPAIASTVTGVNFNNLMEHDTKNKASQLWTLLTGDDEEINKAFYGRGPMTQIPFLNSPVLSDLLSLGHINEWWEMDEDSMTAMLTGYEDYGMVSGDKKYYEQARIFNIQLARTLYRTIPHLLAGNIGYALQGEIGLFRDTDLAKKKKKLTKQISNMLPDELADALAQLEQHQKAAIKPTRKTSGASKKGGVKAPF
tara:strand:+ start:1349 stop:4159 length:2811 start_codon:yes stop_codon:yes gene_type:complete